MSKSDVHQTEGKRGGAYVPSFNNISVEDSGVEADLHAGDDQSMVEKVGDDHRLSNSGRPFQGNRKRHFLMKFARQLQDRIGKLEALFESIMDEAHVEMKDELKSISTELASIACIISPPKVSQTAISPKSSMACTVKLHVNAGMLNGTVGSTSTGSAKRDVDYHKLGADFI